MEQNKKKNTQKNISGYDTDYVLAVTVWRVHTQLSSRLDVDVVVATADADDDA